jgi:hypothetical protein
VVIAIGLLLVVAGVALLLNLGGLGEMVIRRVTSRNLGDLAPGYAASKGGFRVYATLILAIGVTVSGLGLSPSAAIAGVVAIGVGALVFVTASVIAILGEVRTYRALPDRERRR